MTIDELIKRFDNLGFENFEKCCMNLRYVDTNGMFLSYENGDCWGDFLEEQYCPKYVNIPLLFNHDDKIIEWAMSTPLLSAVIMNKNVKCVKDNGWVLDAGEAWSKWYIAGMFCRSFSEQMESIIKVGDEHPSVSYWANFWYIHGYLVADPHGCFYSKSIDTNMMFILPEYKEVEEEKALFYSSYEVHSSDYLYSTDSNIYSYKNSFKQLFYQNLWGSSCFSGTLEDMKNLLSKIRKDNM